MHRVIMDSKNRESRLDGKMAEETQVDCQPHFIKNQAESGQKDIRSTPLPWVKRVMQRKSVLSRNLIRKQVPRTIRRKDHKTTNKDNRTMMNDFELLLQLRIEAENGSNKTPDVEQCRNCEERLCVSESAGEYSDGSDIYRLRYTPEETPIESTPLFRNRWDSKSDPMFFELASHRPGVFGGYDYMSQAVRSEETDSVVALSGVVATRRGNFYSAVAERQDETVNFTPQFDEGLYRRNYEMRPESSMSGAYGEAKYCARLPCKIMEFEKNQGQAILDPPNINALTIAHALEKHGAKRSTRKKLRLLRKRRRLNCRYKDVEIDILAKIGQGTFANEYLVEHKARKKLLNLKVFSGENMEEEYFLKEVKILKKLRGCPLITQIVGYHAYDASFSHKMYFMFLELFAGTTLCDFICTYVVSLEVLMFISWQIGLGLKFMHSKKIVHGDLNPSSILVTNKCRVKIADVGLQKFQGAHEGAEYSGTLNYSAPEMYADGSQQLPAVFGKKSDFFSLGVIIYEIVYGITPIRHLFCKDTSLATTVKKLQMAIDAVRKGRLEYPHYNLDNDLLELLTNLLQVDPKSRLSGGEFVNHRAFKHRRKFLRRAMKIGITALPKEL